MIIDYDYEFIIYHYLYNYILCYIMQYININIKKKIYYTMFLKECIIYFSKSFGVKLVRRSVIIVLYILNIL
jgi:hypothetical protein